MEDSPAPLRLKIAVAVAGLAIFSFVTLMTDSDRGAAVAFAFSAIVVAAYARWDLRGRWFYWAALGVLSALHVALLTIWHPSIPSPAIQTAPLVIIDFICMVLILTGLERLLDANGE